MAMAIEAANPNISEFDKTVSMLEKKNFSVRWMKVLLILRQGDL